MSRGQPVVETSAGKVRGFTLEQCHAFLGIRYAEAKRFEAPKPVAPRSGIAEALKFGPMAPQGNPDPKAPGYGIVLERLAPQSIKISASVESEDCQFLNIWTSSLSPERLKPVMVWLHPGGFMLGSGESGDGTVLAGRNDVVVVTLNHRLNLFGYCHLDDFSSEFRYSGNLGQLDIVAALQWIQLNIDRFGGDPSRVMVFGASGGGMKTAWLMVSPLGKGLIHRAGSQSGPYLKMMGREEACAVAEKLLAELGLRTSQASALRSMEVEHLLLAFHRVRNRDQSANFAPVIDPQLAPRHPFEPDAAPAMHDIPMLLGWNREDMAFFQGNDMSVFELRDEDLVPRLQGLFGNRAGAVAAAYCVDDPASSPSRHYLRALTDVKIGHQILTQAERRAALDGARTYVYRFDHPSPVFDGKFGSLHSSETDYVFGQDGPFVDSSLAAVRMGKAMRNAWAHFAATGDPNAGEGGLPRWEPFDMSRQVMLLAEQSRLVVDPVATLQALR